MRHVLRNAMKDGGSHFGQAYDLFAPRLQDGSPDPDDRSAWIARCAQIQIAADYRTAYERWRDTFRPEDAETEEIAAASRLLVGHGNPSGADVGLTVHRTWGVPVIPGSALKGVAAHYLDAVYGGGEADRRAWLGPTWKGGRVAQGDGAGDEYGYLFGAPEVDGDEKSARGGAVEFHDALYIPGSATKDQPFARDVLTVHQKPYYDNKGEKGAWPNDWTSPTPIPFITVRPGTRFLLVLTGRDEEWRKLAMRLLLEALADWGVGGKTSAGYGRLAPADVSGRRR